MQNYIYKNTEKKKKSQEVHSYIDIHLPLKSSERFKNCGSFVEMLADKDLESMKVHHANYCKNRFCPVCQWRLARKEAMQISVLMDYLEQEKRKQFIFVTLTAPNVSGENLRDEISKYNKAFKNLMLRDEISKMNQGYIRKLEVTYNKKTNTYHPHFHCIFAVNKGYFSGGRYLKQARWLELWQDVMVNNFITQVFVQKVKRYKASNEIAKYSSKSEDYLFSQEVFDVFYKSLKGRQVITYSGMFKDAVKKYKAKELDSYKTTDDTKYVWLLLYQWGGSEYAEKRRQEISEEEYRELKKESIDEMSIG